MKQTDLNRTATLMASAAVVVLALAACNKAPAPTPQNAVAPEAQNTADMSPAPTQDTSGSSYAAPPPARVAAAPALRPDRSPPAPPAPAAAALPPAPPAPVEAPPAPVQQYQYVDQAAAVNSSLANVPPNYAVEYQGAKPWVWRAPTGAYRIVETIPGGQRTYFYYPGARTPYLVRDPQFTYAFDRGRLVVVYDAGGRALPPAVAARQAALAGRYLQRSTRLYDVATTSRREAASAADWRAHQAALAAQQAAWQRDRQNNADWRAWEAQHGAGPGSNGQPPRAPMNPPPGPPPRGPKNPPPGPPPRAPVNPLPGPGGRPPGAAVDQRTRDAQRLHQAQTRVLSARQALADAQVRTLHYAPADRARVLRAAQAKVDQAVAAQDRVQASVDAHR